MIKRGTEIRLGPLRIVVSLNTEGRCETHTIFETTHLGTGVAVPEEVLQRLQDWAATMHSHE